MENLVEKIETTIDVLLDLKEFIQIVKRKLSALAER